MLYKRTLFIRPLHNQHLLILTPCPSLPTAAPPLATTGLFSMYVSLVLFQRHILHTRHLEIFSKSATL